jgi:hypothetical protein
MRCACGDAGAPVPRVRSSSALHRCICSAPTDGHIQTSVLHTQQTESQRCAVRGASVAWRVCRCRSDARGRVTSSRRLSNVAVQWYSVDKVLMISCSGLTARESVHHALSMTHCHICTLRPISEVDEGHSCRSICVCRSAPEFSPLENAHNCCNTPAWTSPPIWTHTSRQHRHEAQALANGSLRDRLSSIGFVGLPRRLYSSMYSLA